MSSSLPHPTRLHSSGVRKRRLVHRLLGPLLLPEFLRACLFDRGQNI